eukprot:1983991-Prymnesium_polylepis.1
MGVGELTLPLLGRLVAAGLMEGKSLPWLTALYGLLEQLVEGATQSQITTLLALPILPCEVPSTASGGEAGEAAVFSLEALFPGARRAPIFLRTADAGLQAIARRVPSVRVLCLPRAATGNEQRGAARPAGSHGLPRLLAKLQLAPLTRTALVDVLLDKLCAPCSRAPSGERWGELRVLRDLVMSTPLDASLDAAFGDAPPTGQGTAEEGAARGEGGVVAHEAAAAAAAGGAETDGSLDVTTASLLLEAVSPKLATLRDALMVPGGTRGELRHAAGLMLPSSLAVLQPAEMCHRHAAPYEGDGGGRVELPMGEALAWEACLWLLGCRPPRPANADALELRHTGGQRGGYLLLDELWVLTAPPPSDSAPTLGSRLVSMYVRACLLYTSPSPRDAHES